jgi:hypothetical protein
MAAVLLAMTASVRADSEPWKQGVTPEQMARAQQLLEAGNARLVDRDYTAALAKYQEAVAVWDHPAIRFNMVRCLIQLDRIVEASENLERALAYGAAPLEDTVYAEALSYQKLLANQVASVTVACTQQGVEVTLDGKQLLTCPGKQARRVVPGQHQIVGAKPGLLTRTTTITVLGGKHEEISLSLDPPSARRGKLTHRWSTWVPWTVLGAGVAVTGGGVLVQRLAINTRDDYHATLMNNCGDSCPGDYAQDRKDRAILENRIAIGMIGVGAAALVTGGVLLYMNRGRVVYEDTVTPVVTPDPHGATVGISGRF